MFLLRWFIRWGARSQGFLDPFIVLGQLRRFGQPSEVLAPTELLRAGAVLQARGLINSQVIQHNTDWVWPYWVVHQFDPADPAFVPRAFSLTQINLTHRNWTAVGLPDCSELPLVDPRGLVTPKLDGWSLDGWLLDEQGQVFVPCQAASGAQRVAYDSRLIVTTEAGGPAARITSDVEVIPSEGAAACEARWTAQMDAGGWLVIALRPYNPEGVSFIHRVEAGSTADGWLVNRRDQVTFSAAPDRALFSAYRQGDVCHRLRALSEERRVHCPVGMATAAALFRLHPKQPRTVAARVPLPAAKPPAQSAAGPAAFPTWDEALKGHCRARLPEPRWQFLYDVALRTLILHSPDDVYPGPYTYKRFWFRDAAFILDALLCAGLTKRVERALDRFPSRQLPTGYFLSQDGEWDANGEALWILHRFCQLSGHAPKPQWRRAVERAGRWIQRKRLAEDLREPHAGLLPAGFSAEHLGPNDYYYWDDFWGVAGLQSAAAMLEAWQEAAGAEAFRREASSLMKSIERSAAWAAQHTDQPAVPASPYRRMDAGAIGSLAAGYPLRLWPARDSRLLSTAEFLMANCLVGGGFYQTISHSGINPYLTLHIAQVLLRAGDLRCLELAEAVARLASPTGQWPEAVHPRTLGGCMGDGQHVWAAAEWVLFIRHLFVREEGEGLILCSGISAAWCAPGQTLSFGPAPTAFGPISLTLTAGADQLTVTWDAGWRRQPAIEVRVPGYAAVSPASGQAQVIVKRVPA